MLKTITYEEYNRSDVAVLKFIFSGALNNHFPIPEDFTLTKLVSVEKNTKGDYRYFLFDSRELERKVFFRLRIDSPLGEKITMRVDGYKIIGGQPINEVVWFIAEEVEFTPVS